MYGKTGDRTNGERQAQMEKHLEAFEELIMQLISWQSHKKKELKRSDRLYAEM